MAFDTIKESIANVMEAKKMLNKAQASVLTEIKKVLPSFEGKVYEDYDGTFLIKKVSPNKCNHDTLYNRITFAASGWMISKYHQLNNIPETFFHTQEHPHRITLKLGFFEGKNDNGDGSFVNVSADEFMSRYNEYKNELKYMKDNRGDIIRGHSSVQFIKDDKIQNGTIIEYNKEKKMFKVATLGEMSYYKGSELFKMNR